MGLEGAVRLGFRRELDAVTDPTERRELEQRLLDDLYERGRAVNAAAVVEIDDVIDPADTRRWILSAVPATAPDEGPRRYIDTW